MSSLPPPLPPPILRPGVKLEGGRYSLLRPLSAGGNGVVWLAHHASLATDVVAKFPKRWCGASAVDAELFVSEMRRLASLSNLHPHIVNILDAGTHRGRPFFVMQYLARGALDSHCGPTRPCPNLTASQSVSLRWIEAIASALDFLHERATIHRDVKPGNILLDESFGAYLADFGIAVPHRLESFISPMELLRREVVTGSLPYMAPEIFAGRPASPASDQFALAVTIFEFVNGRRPFDGTSAEKLVENYRERMTSWQSVMPLGMTAALWAALRRAFDADPALRYSQCLDLARAAEAALHATRWQTSKILSPKPALPVNATDSTASIAACSMQSQRTGTAFTSQQALTPDSPQQRPLSLDRMRQGGRNEKS